MNDSFWDDVVLEISQMQGEVRTIGLDFYKNEKGEFNEISTLWESAKYTSVQVEWINYYPNLHYNKEVENKFSQIVNCKPIRSWISCLRPGKNAPWHQDVDDNLSEYNKLGKLVRYTCFIHDPAYGQLLMIEDKSYYMQSKNTIIKWNNFLDWHGASNCGFKKQYLYHFLGYV